MKSFKQYLAEEEDYKGQHQAPGKDSGAPMHNLKGIYPDDFYSHNGFRYYSDQGNSYDHESHYLTVSKKDKPNHMVSVYRAVPKEVKGAKINKGDWVTINRKYAHDHGMNNLGGKGKYKVIKHTAHVRDLFTDGNSIHEWGYDPQPRDKEADRLKWERRKKLDEHISHIIKNQINEYLKSGDKQLNTVSDINHWSCFDFGFDLAQKMKAQGLKSKLIRGEGHTYIKHNNRYYDAEHINGVQHPKNLNFYRRNPNLKAKI